MRPLLIVIIVFSSMACVGQDFFADNLKNYPWIAEESFDIDKLKKSKKIYLTIFKGSKDLLTKGQTIWTFGDSLIISQYDTAQKKEKQLAKFNYDLEWDKVLLNIRIPNGETLTYRLIFVSTGSFVSLNRRKR